MYQCTYRNLTLNKILELLKGGAVVGVICENPDVAVEEVYIASEIKSEHSFVDVDDISRLDIVKQLDDLRILIHSALSKRRNRVAKLYYVRFSLYSEPLITLEFE